MAFKRKAFRKKRAGIKRRRPRGGLKKAILKVLDRQLEMMTNDTNFDTVAPTGGPLVRYDVTSSGICEMNVVTPFNGNGFFRCCKIPQGINLGFRIGNTIDLLRIECRLDFEMHPEMTNNASRIHAFLIQFNPNGDSTGTANNGPIVNMLYDNPYFNSAAMSFAPKNILTRSQYKVLKSWTIDMVNGFIPVAVGTVPQCNATPIRKVIEYVHHFKKPLKMSWNNALDAPGANVQQSTFCNRNHLYFAAYSDSPPNINLNNKPTVKGMFRSHYHTD